MSRFEKLSHVLWHCQYHIVWVPKYRYRVLTGRIADEVKLRAITVNDGQVFKLNDVTKKGADLEKINSVFLVYKKKYNQRISSKGS